MLSTQTLLQIYGYDVQQESDRKKKEQSDGTADALGGKGGEKPSSEKPDGERKPGRPQMDDSERKSDPAKALVSKQPKPINPEGS